MYYIYIYMYLHANILVIHIRVREPAMRFISSGVPAVKACSTFRAEFHFTDDYFLISVDCTYAIYIFLH